MLLGKRGQALRTFILRRVRRIPQFRSGADSGAPDPLAFHGDSGYDRGRGVTLDHQLLRLREAVAALPPLSQRVIRLRWALFPARRCWSEAKVARHLGLRDPQRVGRVERVALGQLRDRFCGGFPEAA